MADGIEGRWKAKKSENGCTTFFYGLARDRP